MFDLLERAASPSAPATAAALISPVSATDVAHVLRLRVPGLSAPKLHMLLYYCQGQHLATQGVQLFAESISAWDAGPVVDVLWLLDSYSAVPMSLRQLSDAQLDTVDAVVRRYGSLSERDLQTLTRHESPWLLADVNRAAGATSGIRVEWIREHFLAVARDEPATEVVEVAIWVPDSRTPDNVTRLVPEAVMETPVALAA